MEQDSAASVASRVTAGDELRKGFGCKFLAAELLAVLVAAFHQSSEQIHAVDVVGIVQSLLDAGDSDAS